MLQAGIVYCPGKAANAGGVAVSGLEMTQNRMVSALHSSALHSSQPAAAVA